MDTAKPTEPAVETTPDKKPAKVKRVYPGPPYNTTQEQARRKRQRERLEAKRAEQLAKATVEASKRRAALVAVVSAG